MSKAISVGVPSAGHPRIDFINSLLALATSGLVSEVLIIPRLPVHQAREQLARRFTGTHLLMIDDDMTFQPADVVRLIAANKDIVSGLYYRRSDKERKACVFKLENGTFKFADPGADELHQVDGVSLAFTLIRREVIDKVGTDFRFAGGLGEDLDYIKRARAAGFECWLEPRARIGHITEAAI